MKKLNTHLMNIRITGVGSYIPKIVQKNEAFKDHSFLNIDGSEIPSSNEVIVEKFKAITGISERRYAEDHLTASDLGALAAEKAIADAGIDPETLDYIILILYLRCPTQSHRYSLLFYEIILDNH